MSARGRAASLVALALAALAADAGRAQQGAVRVRAGEHPGYSRLVLDAQAGTGFEWGVEGRTLTLALSGGAVLDTGAATRTRLSRVAQVAAEGGVLRVTLNCDCGARASRIGDGRIVIDVAEGAPRPAPTPALAAKAASPAAALSAGLAPRTDATPPRPRPAPAAAGAPPSGGDAQAAATPPARQTAGPAAAQETEATRAPAAEVGGPAGGAAATPQGSGVTLAQPAAAPPPPPAPTDAQSVTIEAARQRLLEQLTRAADEGLVTLAPRADAEAALRGGVEVDPDAEAPLRARNALDIARDGEIQVPAAGRPLPKDCLGPQHFEVAAWAGDAPFDEQAATLRRDLVGEFDAPNPEGVIAYARLLVHFGFGLEAKLALRAFGDLVPAPPALAEMATLVDREAPPADGVLARGLGCPGGHGAWAAAAAARAGVLKPEDIDADALRPALSALPDRLRAPIVTPIAEVALDGGKLKTAEMLATIGARADPEGADGDGMLRILLARLDAARGAHDKADAALAAIAAQSSPAGVEALLRLSASRLERGAPQPRGLAENMEAVAFSLGQSDYARRLMAASARARASSEGLGPALAALATLAGRSGDPGAARQAAQTMLADYAPAPAEAPAYAEAVLTHWALVGDGPDGDPARLAVAQRLARMGVENLAEILLAPAVARGLPEARMIAARAATAAGAPDRALGHLKDVDGPEAARARAEALSALGRHGEAARSAEAAGDPALAARYAWLAGNWAAASAAGQVDRRILAAWMAGQAEMPPEIRAAVEADPATGALAETFTRDGAEATDATLVERAESVLEAARKRREVMGGLLSDG